VHNRNTIITTHVKPAWRQALILCISLAESDLQQIRSVRGRSRRERTNLGKWRNGSTPQWKYFCRTYIRNVTQIAPINLLDSNCTSNRNVAKQYTLHENTYFRRESTNTALNCHLHGNLQSITNHPSHRKKQQILNYPP